MGIILIQRVSWANPIKCLVQCGGSSKHSMNIGYYCLNTFTPNKEGVKMSSKVEFRILSHFFFFFKALVECILCHERVGHRILGGFLKSCPGVFLINQGQLIFLLGSGTFPYQEPFLLLSEFKYPHVPLMLKSPPLTYFLQLFIYSFQVWLLEEGSLLSFLSTFSTFHLRASPVFA